MKITLKRKKTDETELLQKTIREQKARIEDLKRENADLLYSLDEYTKKENSILESIGYLEEKKREQTESLNKKYALELQKLRFFEEKWLNVVRNSDDPSLFAGISYTREALKKCREEILNTTRKELKISKDLTAAEEDFASETVRLRRLREEKSFNPPEEELLPSEFKKYRDRLKKAEEDSNAARGSAPEDEPESARLAESFYQRFGIPLSSDRRTDHASEHKVGVPGDTYRRAESCDPAEPTVDEAVNANESCKSNVADGTTAEFEPPYPRRDKTDSAPISEPDAPISPKKMTDREIVSLLEKLSV